MTDITSLKKYVQSAGGQSAGGGLPSSNLATIQSYVQSAQPTAQTLKIQQDQTQSLASNQEAQRANSPMGLIKATVGDIGARANNYAQESANTVTSFGNAILHPLDTLSKLPSFFTKPMMAGEQKAGDALYGLVTDKGASNKVADAANIISGIGQAIFSPISGLNQIAMKTPGLKQVADAINIPFTAAGVAGAYATGKILDVFPDSVISKESKNILREPLKEVGAFASQIVLGGKLMEGISEFSKGGKAITPEVARKLVVQATDEASAVPISTSATRHADYAKAQGYEPYTPPEKLPTIQMGGLEKAKEVLPTIQIGESMKVTKTPDGKFTYEPISQNPVAQSTPPSVLDRVTKPQTESVPPTRVVPIVGGDTATAKLSTDIETKLNTELGSLPEYQTMNLAEQASRSLDLIKNNPELAKSIAMGDTPAPSGLREGAVFTALREQAKASGDVNTLIDLAHSKLATEASELGQRIKAFDTFRDPTDPVNAIQEVVKAREKNASKNGGEDVVKAKSTTVKDIQTEIKKTAPTKQSWSDFVEQIKCNY